MKCPYCGSRAIRSAETCPMPKKFICSNCAELSELRFDYYDEPYLVKLVAVVNEGTE